MAEKTEKETSEKQKFQTFSDNANTDGQENIGEVSDTEQKSSEHEKKERAEFSPLDLGNEDNVSDWLVNMLSSRLWDFAINNLEWAGDLCDRAFFARSERNAEKRRMALNIKAAKQRAAESAKKTMTNEDGTINAGAAKTRVYDDEGKLVKLGDYEVQPNDKLVDAEGKPLQGKTPQEIENQIQQSRKNVAAKENNGKAPEKEKGSKEGKKKEKKKPAKGKGKAKGTKEKGTKKQEGNSQKNTRARQKRSPRDAAQTARSTQQAKKDLSKQGRVASNKKRAVNKDKQETQSSKNKILNLSRQNQQSRANTNTINRSAKRDGRG